MWAIILVLIIVIAIIFIAKAISDGYKCPVCEEKITDINDLSNGKFNNLPICKDCIEIIDLYRGGQKEGIIYLDDLKEIVNDYHNKQASFLKQTNNNINNEILIVDKETGEVIEEII